MKKFFALLLSACLFISCGINEFGKKGSVGFSIPKEVLAQIQSQARDVVSFNDDNQGQNDQWEVEVVPNNENENGISLLIYTQLKGSKGYEKDDFLKINISDNYSDLFQLERSIVYENANEKIEVNDAEISFQNLPVNQAYDIFVDIFAFEEKGGRKYIHNWIYSGTEKNVSIEPGVNKSLEIMMNPSYMSDYTDMNPLEMDAFIICNEKRYSNIGKYKNDSSSDFYFYNYDDKGEMDYIKIEDNTEYKFGYTKNERFPKIKHTFNVYNYNGDLVSLQEINLEEVCYFENQFMLGDLYLTSCWLDVSVLEENPEGKTEVDVLPIYKYFDIEEDGDKFIFSRDDLFNQTSVTYLIDTTNELTIDDVKTSLNFNDLTQDGVEIPDANSFTLWLFVQSGIDGTYYFNLTFEKENDVWTYYTNEEKEYSPISTYFDLIINKDDEGNYYPTVELQSEYSEKEGFSNFDSNKIKIFVVGGDNNITKDVLESSNDMYKNFSFNNNLIYSEQLFTIAFATEIDSNLEYFKSVIECEVSSNPYKWLNYDDASLKIINKTATESIDETSAGSFIDDKNSSIVSLEFTKDTEGQTSRYRCSIPLSDVLDEGKKLTDGDTIAFVLNFYDSNLTYFKDKKFYYQLRPSTKNSSGETVPNNLLDQNNYCVDLVEKSDGETTLVLPINKLNTKIKDSDGSELEVEYLQFYFDGQGITGNNYTLECSVDYFIFPASDEAYVFALTKNYDEKTKSVYPYRYEISELMDLELKNGDNVNVTLSGELYTIGYNGDKQIAEERNDTFRTFNTEIFDSSPNANYYTALSQDGVSNEKYYELSSCEFEKKFKYNSIINCHDYSIYKFQCYSICYDTSKLLVLKNVGYKVEIESESEITSVMFD